MLILSVLLFLIILCHHYYSEFILQCDPTAEVRDPYDLCDTPEQIQDNEKIRHIFETNVNRAVDSDIVIAFIPSASMGTAVEIHEAWQAKKIVYTISPLARNWVIRLYSTKIFSTMTEFKEFFKQHHSTTLPAVHETTP